MIVSDIAANPVQARIPGPLRHGRRPEREAEWQAVWDEFDGRRPPKPQAPPAVAPKPPPRRLRRLLPYMPALLLTACLAGAGLALISGPLLAARDVMRAVAQVDGPALAAHMDWEAIRPSLREALVNEARLTANEGFSPGARRYLGEMADAMTVALEQRPEALAGLLRSRTDSDWQAGEMNGLLPAGALRRLRPDGLSGLRLELGRPGHEMPGLNLTLAPSEKGASPWRIVSLGFGAP